MVKIWLIMYVWIVRGGKPFIPKTRLFDREELKRIESKMLEGSERSFNVASPEGTILNKLEWYKMGGGVSDRQWNDILGVLKIRGTALDMQYLKHWAATLGVADFLERALDWTTPDSNNILYSPPQQV